MINEKLDIIAINISKDICNHINAKMKKYLALDVEFHKYKLDFLNSVLIHDSQKQNLQVLTKKINTNQINEINNFIDEKFINEISSKYIFSQIITYLNSNYLTILENEHDKISNENSIISQKADKLKDKLNHH